MRPEPVPTAKRWETRSAPAIQAIGDDAGSIVAIPVGSVEQHGAHLPVGTDSMLVSSVLGDAIERLESDFPILVTPTVWCGYSPHHLSFGGTLSVDFEHMHHLLEDIAETAVANGFDAVVLVNGHGGNKAVISAAVNTIGEGLSGVDVIGITYFDLATEFIDEIRESGSGGMGHGGEFETSLMAHLYPHLVEDDRHEGTVATEPYDRSSVDLVESGPVEVYRPFEEYAENGVIGDPGLASAEKGEQLLTELGSRLAEVFRDVHDETA